MDLSSMVCGLWVGLGWKCGTDPLVYGTNQYIQHRSKKKGHHHHHGGLDHPHPHHHAHHPETPEAAVAEPEEEEVVEEEEEEEEPAPVLLVGVPRVYSCGECRTHLASDMDVISRVGWWVGVWWWG